MRIVQHNPGFIDAPRRGSRFADTAGLLAVKWVASWAKVPGFIRFSLSDELLVAEFEDGKWWVVGVLDDPTGIELPAWAGPPGGKGELPYPELYKSARIANLWRYVMHLFGYRDFCESTTEFQYIDYAYTSDAPKECIERGEALWKELFRILGDAERGGRKVVLHTGGQMSTITRRRELWDK